MASSTPLTRGVYCYGFLFQSLTCIAGLMRAVTSTLIVTKFAEATDRSEREPVRPAMSDQYDDLNGSQDPFNYQDTISQRAMAFCHLAKLADQVKDEAVKDF